MKVLGTLFVALLLAVVCQAQTIPAFPGAEGSGAPSIGGRGGVVAEVTNLNDSGAGSLRACTAAAGPRNCVFRVGGVINLIGDLRISNPYLTISGQTAPGGGIKLAGSGAVMWVNTHDVVIRYLSYDGNSANNGPSFGSVSFDAGSGNVYNVVFDHVSGFHVTNKQLIVLCNDAGPVKNVTFQWSMTYKPDIHHPVGPMTDATTCQAKTVTNVDYHHNFFADTSHRLPLFNTQSGRFVSNLIYNWDFFAGLWQGGTTSDIIANRYVAGNMNSGDNDGHPHALEFNFNQSADDLSHSMPGPPSIFLSGNSGPQGTDVAITGQVSSEGGKEVGPVPSSWWRSTPLPPPQFPITTSAAATLDTILMPLVGNSQKLNCDGTMTARRQVEDTDIIKEYQTKSPPGSLWVAPAGYVTPPVANGPACVETLHDGIPDQWKVANGLSVTDPNLYKTKDATGYTYLEKYSNGSGITPPPPVVTGVSVSCSPTTIPQNGTSTCTAIVTGTGNYDKTVVWSANGGTVTQGGVFTPASGSTSGVITATSTADPTKKGSATVTVTPTPPPTFQLLLNCTYDPVTQKIACAGTGQLP